MKKSVMLKWVKALRSGKYKRGVGALKYKGKFCCLGVLCDISKLGEWAGVDSTNYKIPSGGSSGAVPNLKVREWAGLKTDIGYLGATKLSLYELNDHQNKSFKQIADYIEENYKDL